MKRRLGLAALVLAQILSGVNNPLIRLALHTMPVFLFGFLRVSIALLVIGPIAYLERKKRPLRKRTIKRSDLLLIILGSALIYSGGNLFFYIGIHQSTTINSAIIELVKPMIFFMITIEVLKERFNKRIFVGILLAFLGAVIVVLGPLLSHASTNAGTLTGNAFLAAEVLADVAGTVILKKALKHVHVLDVLAIGLISATVFYAIGAFPELGKLSLLAQPSILIPVLYGALVIGCLGYALGYYGLAKTKGSDYSIIGYVTPVVAMTVAAVFFHETFTPSLLVGGVVVFTGLYLVEARNLVHLHKIPGFHK